MTCKAWCLVHVGHQVQIGTIGGSARQKIEPGVNKMDEGVQVPGV